MLGRFFVGEVQKIFAQCCELPLLAGVGILIEHLGAIVDCLIQLVLIVSHIYVKLQVVQLHLDVVANNSPPFEQLNQVLFYLVKTGSAIDAEIAEFLIL